VLAHVRVAVEMPFSSTLVAAAGATERRRGCTVARKIALLALSIFAHRGVSRLTAFRDIKKTSCTTVIAFRLSIHHLFAMAKSTKGGFLTTFVDEQFSATIFKSIDTRPAPTEISIPGAIWDIVTCKFLVYGDQAKDIRGQLMQEQLNIALVSALFLTISIPAMLWITELEHTRWTELERSIFGLSLCLATANFAIAVIFAVFFSLSIQECVDEDELHRFTSHMGRYLQLSSVSFIIGILTLGGYSWTFWCYVTFRIDWFLGIALGCIGLNTFFIVFSGLIMMVKKLYAAKGGRGGLVILSRDQISRAIQAYLDTLAHADLADLDCMKEFVLSRTRCSAFSPQSLGRLHVEWQKALLITLKEQYEVENLEDDSRRRKPSNDLEKVVDDFLENDRWAAAITPPAQARTQPESDTRALR
jgi:hypothetical protein